MRDTHEDGRHDSKRGRPKARIDREHGKTLQDV